MAANALPAVTTAQTSVRTRGFRLTWSVLLAFFLVNLAFTGFLAVSHDKASSDALSYYALAQNLADGKGLSRDHKSDPAAVETSPPFKVSGRFLYPWFVSLGFRAFGESIAIANLVAAIFKAVLVIPILLIAKYLFDDDLTGLAAGLIYTVSPAYTSLGTIAMPETTASAFYYVSVLLFLLYYVHSPGWRMARRGLIAAAGLALSLAYLARPEALLLLLLGLVTIWLGSHRWTDVLFLLLFPALTFTVGSLLIYGRMGNVSPYQTPLTTLPDWADFYVLSGFSLTTYLGRVGGLGGALAVRVYNCLLFLRHTFADGLWLTGVVGLLPFTFIPALAAAFFRPLSRSLRRYLIALGLFTFLQLVATIGYPGYPNMSADYRHGQIVGPFLIVLAAAGLVYLLRGWRPLRERATGRILGAGFGSLLVVNYAVFAVVFLSIGLNDTLWVPVVQEPLVEASRWLRDNVPAGAVIMSRKPAVVGYVSERTSVVIPTAPYADIMAYAARHHATNFVITDMERSAVPNLVQGMDVYADHFQRLFTADTFTIVGVKSYDYPGSLPTVKDDWYVGPENVRRDLYDWSDLWSLGGSSAWSDAQEAWSQWVQRAKLGIWGLAKDRSVPAPMRDSVDATFGDSIRLMGYDLNVDRVSPGGTFELTLYWRCLRPMTQDYVVFTHALDPGQAVRAQQDHQPLDGARATHLWEVGELVRDRYTLTLDPSSPPGKYAVEVGLYDGATLERLPVHDRDGADVAERRALTGSLKVK